MNDITLPVKDLLNDGYTFVPVSLTIVQYAVYAAELFMRAKKDKWKDWSFEEQNLGIISRALSQKGNELCYASNIMREMSFRGLRQDPLARECFTDIEALYVNLKRAGVRLANQLHKEMEVTGLLSAVKSSFESHAASQSTKVRFMSYLPSYADAVYGKESDGILTFYFGTGDISIWNERSQSWCLATPPLGRLLVFFGQQAQAFNPLFKPAKYQLCAREPSMMLATVYGESHLCTESKQEPCSVLPFIGK